MYVLQYDEGQHSQLWLGTVWDVAALLRNGCYPAMHLCSPAMHLFEATTITTANAYFDDIPDACASVR
jgi:hypothetical protein